MKRHVGQDCKMQNDEGMYHFFHMNKMSYGENSNSIYGTDPVGWFAKTRIGGNNRGMWQDISKT